MSEVIDEEDIVEYETKIGELFNQADLLREEWNIMND